MPKKDKIKYAKLIANPGAGNPSENSVDVQREVQWLHQNGIEADVAFAKPKKEVTPITKRALKDGYKLIIAMGGDGTIEAALRGLIGSKARLGMIPSGTENNFAKSLGIPDDVEEACRLIVEQPVRKLDVGQVSVKGQKKTYFFELVSIGLSEALYHSANDLKEGNLARFKDAALNFLQEETYPKVYLTLDDESKIEIETLLVVISNTPFFGNNFLVAPSASLEDGLLDISVYPNFRKAELIAYYARIRNEGYSENDKVQRFRAREIEIKASPKLEVVADGNKIGEGKAKIKVRPRAVSVIAPPISDESRAKDEMKQLPPPIYPAEEKDVLEKATS
jgi:diacylglycerol kinase (ATP)